MAGSVFKRGNVWYIRWDALPVNGKRKQKMKACPGMTKKEAEDELNKMLYEVQSKYDPSMRKLEDHLSTCSFMEDFDEATMELLKEYINPSIGNLTFSQISPRVLHELFQTLKSNPFISNQTLKAIYMTLCEVFQKAVEWELINVNTVVLVNPPKKD